MLSILLKNSYLLLIHSQVQFLTALVFIYLFFRPNYSIVSAKTINPLVFTIYAK